MLKIEKPWAAFGSIEKTQYGLITEDCGDVVFITDSEKSGQSTSWNREYVERFVSAGDLADYLYQKLDKLHSDIVVDIKAKFPIACEHVDLNGRDLSIPIPPLDTLEWEDMQVKGEVACVICIEDARKQIEELGNIICRLSEEILRLRLTYGEEVWNSVYHTREEENFIRKTHEAERGKYTLIYSNPEA